MRTQWAKSWGHVVVIQNCLQTVFWGVLPFFETLVGVNQASMADYRVRCIGSEHVHQPDKSQPWSIEGAEYTILEQMAGFEALLKRETNLTWVKFGHFGCEHSGPNTGVTWS